MWQHLAPVGSDCPVRHPVGQGPNGVTLHPNGRVHHPGAQPQVNKVPFQSVTDGFLCSREHSKMSFQLLKRF